MIISTYQNLTPIELRERLMNAVKVGDTDELHNALIVLCNITAKQQKQIKDLSLQLQKVMGYDYSN